MKRKVRLSLVLATAGLIVAGRAFAWGGLGHEVTAQIAFLNMSAAGRAKLETLLASDPDTLTATDFASRTEWADRYRIRHRDTSSWHYTDVEIDAPNLQEACFGFPKLSPGQPASAGPSRDCLLDKVEEFAAELHSRTTTPYERLMAFKFLIHFVGDLHQPLHAADHADRGGNCVPVQVGPNERPSNLHAYWDTGVLKRLGRGPEDIAANLAARITPAEVKAWAGEGNGGPESVSRSVAAWERESYATAKAVAYNLPSRPTCENSGSSQVLSAAYQARAETTAALQLEKAGVRLAWLLDREL